LALGGDFRDTEPTAAAPNARTGPEGAPPAAGPPRGDGPRPRRRAVGLRALLVLGGAVGLVIAAVVALLLTPPVQKAGELVEELIEPAPLRASGITDTEIVFGMAAPLSGGNRELGQGMRAGLEAAFGAVNDEGGVHGRRLRLVALDDGYDPSRTLPAMRQLVEEQGVFAVVGNVGTPTAAVALPYSRERKVLFFGAFTGGDLLRTTPPERYVFNFRPSYAEETAAATRFLVGVRRVDPRRIAVFAQEDELGASGLRGVVEALAESGVSADEIPRFGYRRNTTEVAGAVAALGERAGEVDAVVIIATYRPAAAFIRRAREAGLTPIFTSISAVDASSLAEDLASAGLPSGGEVVVTQVVPLATSRSPGAVRYREALERHAPASRLGPVSFEGWIVGRLLVEGLRRAGRELDTEKLVAALHGIGGLDLGIGARVGFSPTEHQASRKVFGVILQRDGSYRQVALEPRDE
jgi:branched-chain amino acid transport system substrate-binding protein